MKHEVLVLRRAEQDIDTIVGFLAPHSPSGACRWLDALQDALASLEENPGRFPLAPENEALAYTVRQVSFKTPRGRLYRLVYTVIGSQVRALRILGPGHDFLTEDDLA